MEITNPARIDNQLITDKSDKSVGLRLNILLAANAEITKRKLLYPTAEFELAANAMRRPLDSRTAFAYLGLMLGAFPPASFFLSYLVSNGASDEVWIAALLFWVNLVTAATGFFLGKVVGSILSNFGKQSFTFFALLTPLIGFLWGAICGAAGGVFIFVIGAFFGAFIGGIVGAVALPSFLLVHRQLKTGDIIEFKHFLPIAAGITFSICAFILNLFR